MALVTNQWQGSYKGFPSRTLSFNKGLTPKQQLNYFRVIGKSDRLTIQKHHLCLRVGSPRFYLAKVRPLRVLSFKGSSQTNGSGGRPAKVPQNSVELPYVAKQNDETLAEGSIAHEIPITCPPETNGNKIAGSPAIHKLFQNWLMMLTTPSAGNFVEEILGEGPPPREISKEDTETQVTKRGGVLSVLWCHFCSLDAAIKVPLLVFIPLSFAVNVVFGSEVSKELTPLWILGPLLVALYIKTVSSLSSLYAFTFKHTAMVLKDLPKNCTIAYKYVSHGKLKEDVTVWIWLPLVRLRDLDYKELSRRKLGEFQEWSHERYLDYVESIWPHYCKVVRFLKTANLI